jgi:hypothetical protein
MYGMFKILHFSFLPQGTEQKAACFHLAIHFPLCEMLCDCMDLTWQKLVRTLLLRKLHQSIEIERKMRTIKFFQLF